VELRRTLTNMTDASARIDQKPWTSIPRTSTNSSTISGTLRRT
jgi:hypothetical protein